MSQLIIPKQIFDEMLVHCKEGYPDEACGILAGRGGGVLKIYKVHNIENSPVTYLMDPMEQFKVMKDMRANDLSMIAIYHSHPSSTPYPSQRDVNLAFYEDTVYVIVSLIEKEPVVKGFSIREGDIKEIEVIREKS